MGPQVRRQKVEIVVVFELFLRLRSERGSMYSVLYCIPPFIRHNYLLAPFEETNGTRGPKWCIQSANPTHGKTDQTTTTRTTFPTFYPNVLERFNGPFQ